MASYVVEHSGEDKPSRSRTLKGIAGVVQKSLLVAIPAVGVLYVFGVHSYLGIVLWQEQYLGLFITLVLASAFLGVPARKGGSRETVPWYDLLGVMAAFVVGMYIAFSYPRVLMSGMKATPLNVTLGGILIVLALEAARRFLGWIFVIVTGAFIIYGAYTNFFPGFLWGNPTPWPRLAVHLYLDATSFLYLTSIAATLILAFVIFGSVLFSFGGGKFLTELALSLTGGFRGGPAKAAVVASTLFGTMSGSALSNIAVVGSVTIPLMKRTGYPPHIAAAIEAVASNGGMIMPPVMGIVAFIMAQLTGISYLRICLAAAIPAVLYYAALFVEVDLEAARLGMRGLPRHELPPLLPILRRGWLVLLPLLFLIYTLLIMNLAPERAALYAAIFGILVLPLMKENRIRFWHRLLQVFESSGGVLINAGTMLICAGFILAAVGITGLGFKMSLGLVQLGRDNIWLLLLIAAISSMAMGMGLPASACYILVAVLVAPALVNLGISLVAAHLFVIYYANMALITPPIALGVFVAAGLANANPMSTGWYAMRLAILSYIVPFLFVFSPSLLFQGPIPYIAIEFIAAMLGTFAIGVGLAGYLFRKLSWAKRVLIGLGALALFASIIMNMLLLAPALKAAGLLIAGAPLWMEWRWHSQVVRATPGLPQV